MFVRAELVSHAINYFLEKTLPIHYVAVNREQTMYRLFSILLLLIISLAFLTFFTLSCEKSTDSPDSTYVFYIEPDTLYFNMQAGQAEIDSQPVIYTNGQCRIVIDSIKTGYSWIDISGPSGSMPDSIYVRVDASALSEGVYTDWVRTFCRGYCNPDNPNQVGYWGKVYKPFISVTVAQ